MNTRLISRVAFCFFSALLMVACNGAADADGLSMTSVWARPNPPDTDRTAIYGTVVNDSSETVQLTGANSDRCAMTELHTTVTEDDVAKMRPAEPDLLRIPAGEQLRLEPGGLHVMCMGVSEALVEGESVSVTFSFDSGEAISVDAAIKQQP